MFSGTSFSSFFTSATLADFLQFNQKLAQKAPIMAKTNTYLGILA
jgi:hypothetical protein